MSYITLAEKLLLSYLENGKEPERRFGGDFIAIDIISAKCTRKAT